LAACAPSPQVSAREALARVAHAGAGRGPVGRLRNTGGLVPMRPRRIYEIIFAGEAGEILRVAFDDCTVITGSGQTTLRIELPDQAAFFGFMERIRDFGLEVIELRSVAIPRVEHPEEVR